MNRRALRTVNVIYLSKNMEGYRAANYQVAVKESFEEAFNVFTYGPGFSSFSASDTWEDIVEKSCLSSVDFVVSGHAWLHDSPSANLVPMPLLQLKHLSIPRILILNKEYTRLDEKLAYARDQGFDFVLSHHPRAPEFGMRASCRGVYWPFAARDSLVAENVPEERRFDLGFSGVLGNANASRGSSSPRELLQRELFFSLAKVPIHPKASAKDLTLYWNALPTTNLQKAIHRVMGGTTFTSEADYYSIIARAKLWFASASPMDLVSPRYFEALALGTVPLSPGYENLNAIFEPEKHYFQIDATSSIVSQLRDVLSDPETIATVAEAGKALVAERHLLSHRIDTVVQLLQ